MSYDHDGQAPLWLWHKDYPLGSDSIGFVWQDSVYMIYENKELNFGFTSFLG